MGASIALVGVVALARQWHHEGVGIGLPYLTTTGTVFAQGGENVDPHDWGLPLRFISGLAVSGVLVLTLSKFNGRFMRWLNSPLDEWQTRQLYFLTFVLAFVSLIIPEIAQYVFFPLAGLILSRFWLGTEASRVFSSLGQRFHRLLYARRFSPARIILLLPLVLAVILAVVPVQSVFAANGSAVYAGTPLSPVFALIPWVAAAAGVGVWILSWATSHASVPAWSPLAVPSVPLWFGKAIRSLLGIGAASVYLFVVQGVRLPARTLFRAA